jgi:hypothetical protein
MPKITPLALQLLLLSALIFNSSSLSLKLHHLDGGIVVQNNLAAPNWIYGSLTEQQLKKSVFDLMTQNVGLLKCNINYPFYDGKKCINCAGETPYFNLSTKQCEVCGGTGKVINHVCQ